ncbi:MAG: acyl-[acyl-carrier-protein] thioesterase [Candidatus Ventricola sp.]
MLKTYSETFTVRATECDKFRRMRLDALFISMQEVGEQHAIRLGVGYEAMLSRGLFFALTRVHVHVSRAPRQGERVVHTTWPGTCSRFFCPRYHVFTLEDGTPLLTAGALWVILDARSRSIVSPAKLDLGFPDTSDLAAPIELPHRLPSMQLSAQPLHLTRTPVYSEFDVNSHVNNTRYMAWLCDALGSDALNGRYIGDLVAGYEKEIREEAPLQLTLSRDGERFAFQIVGNAGVKHFVAGGTLREEVGL